MYCIILFLQILIINKYVFSYPVSTYKVSYLPVYNGNYPYMTTYPVSVTPIAYYNKFIYTDGIRPIVMYDEMAYYGRRRCPMSRGYTYSRSFPIYSSSFTPYLVVQPKLSNISGLSSVVYTSAPISTSPSLSLSTKLVTLPIKLRQNGTYIINMGKKSIVDITYEPTSIGTDRSATNSIVKDHVDYKTNGVYYGKAASEPTALTGDNSTAESSSATKYTKENSARKADNKYTVSEFNIIGEDNNAVSTSSSKPASESNTETYINAEYVSNPAAKTYTAPKESGVVSETNVSGSYISGSESITETTEPQPISGKVVFKGLIPASGRVKIFKKF